MNVYIMVDMEGISGIFAREQVMSDGSGSRYQEGRHLMAKDINVCVKACKEAGNYLVNTKVYNSEVFKRTSEKHKPADINDSTRDYTCDCALEVKSAPEERQKYSRTECGTEHAPRIFNE